MFIQHNISYKGD